MMKKFIGKILFLFLPGVVFSNNMPNFFEINQNGLIFNKDNGSYQGALHGHLYYEGNYFQNNQYHFNNGSYLNDAYTAETLTFQHDWQFFSDQEWLQSNHLKNLNISYGGSNWFSGVAGQFDPTFGLENDTATNYLPMINEALAANTFDPNYGVGGGAQVNNQHWVWSASVTGPRIAQNYTGHDPLALISQVLYVPWHTDTRVLHFGLGLWQQYPDGSHTISFNTSPEVMTNINTTLANTGNIQNVTSSFTSDLSSALVWHAYSLQGEYFLNETFRDERENHLHFSGYYLTGGYFLTGESWHYNYPGGYFDGVSPAKHAYGAFQILAQLSELDLNSQDIRGGKETNFSGGLSWYVNQNFIAKLNVIRILSHLPTTNARYGNMAYGLQLIAAF